MGRLKSLFPYDQFQLIVGSLMGDARLECRSKNIKTKLTARLRIHHSNKQRDYVFWKYRELKNLISKGPRLIKTWHDKKRDKIHFSWYFHTRSTEELGLIHELFYRSNRKVVSKVLLELINPIGLAV